MWFLRLQKGGGWEGVEWRTRVWLLEGQKDGGEVAGGEQ